LFIGGPRHGRQLETATFSGAKPRGRLGAAPARGLCKRSPQRPVAGRFVRLPPTGAGRGRGALGPTRPAVETAALGEAKPPAAVGRSPPPGGLASEARNVQLPGVLCGFHPWAMAAAEGGGARYGLQLETAAFGGAKPPGAVGGSPRQGAWQMKPATSRCRAFCAASPHGRWPRPRALALGRPAVENCGLRWGETAGAVGDSPARGLGKRSPQRPVAGRPVRLPPMDDGRGRGQWA